MEKSRRIRGVALIFLILRLFYSVDKPESKDIWWIKAQIEIKQSRQRVKSVEYRWQKDMHNTCLIPGEHSWHVKCYDVFYRLAKLDAVILLIMKHRSWPFISSIEKDANLQNHWWKKVVEFVDGKIFRNIYIYIFERVHI